ncbi:MAG: F0F1 ATP synthase subunit A [Planctomycetaceae bacterium]|nr:F0F1 ATP synthase subunit A [Planctomycetaceae bacterium]
MLFAEHGTFHHVYDFPYFELPFVDPVALPAPFGFQLTKFMVLQAVAALLVIFIFRGLARRVRTGDTASGWWWNFWELLAVYVRDEVVRPIIGDPHAHHGHGDHDDHAHPEYDEPLHGHQHPYKEALTAEVRGLSSGNIHGGHPADAYAPFIWSCFFYILVCNLLGAVPWLGSATGSISVTIALALVAFGATFMYGVKQSGLVGFWTSLVPDIDAPGPLKMMLIPMIFGIEVLGLFIKHAVLAVRLFANIMGGHTVLGVILGFIAMAAHSGMWYLVTPASILGQIGVGLLELLVAFIQAYVFAFLATIFVGMSLSPH